MWKCASPNAILLASGGGIFETLPFDWTCGTDGLGREDGRFPQVTVRNVFRKENLWKIGTRDTAGVVDCE